MRKTCFCFQIQIPAMPRNFRFFEMEQNHQYFSDSQIRAHVRKVEANILSPFLEMLKALSIETKDRFKAGISISGNTLVLLQKIVPDTITKLDELVKNNCIEFLSEPWSHSILPFLDENLLLKQADRHDKIVNNLFGITPKVFIKHYPGGSVTNFATTTEIQKTGIFSYANHRLLSNNKAEYSGLVPSDSGNLLLINNRVGKILQKIDFDPNRHLLEQYISKILTDINRSLSHLYPLIAVYNPVKSYKPFHMNQMVIWKKVITRLLHLYGYQFTLPNEMLILVKPTIAASSQSIKNPKDYHLSDFWLSNSMQHDALKKQLEILQLMQQVKSISLQAKWDYLQDMDNLFFMSNKYFNTKFQAHHFTPYANPYDAYINYMNVLDGLILRLKKKQHMMHGTESK